MCTKPFSQTKNKGKQFLVAKSSGALLARMPLNCVVLWTVCYAIIKKKYWIFARMRS